MYEKIIPREDGIGEFYNSYMKSYASLNMENMTQTIEIPNQNAESKHRIRMLNHKP